MYQILNLNNGETFEIDKPRYVKLDERGIWVQCGEVDAQCLSVNGDRYSLANKEIVEDAPQVVVVREIDAAKKLAQINFKSIQNAQNLDEVKAAVQDLLWAVADIYR